MVRDILFNCGILYFTWQYVNQGGSHMRICAMDQTRFAPVYNYMGVPFWGIGHLSDLPYVFDIRELPAGIDSSPAHLSLAREMSSDIIAFVNEKPGGKSGGQFSSNWTPAYASNDQLALKGEYPQAINLKIFWGPEGSGMAPVSGMEKPQGTRDHWVAQQKLLERCDFLNSQRVREERGV